MLAYHSHSNLGYGSYSDNQGLMRFLERNQNFVPTKTAVIEDNVPSSAVDFSAFSFFGGMIMLGVEQVWCLGNGPVLSVDLATDQVFGVWSPVSNQQQPESKLVINVHYLFP